MKKNQSKNINKWIILGVIVIFGAVMITVAFTNNGKRSVQEKLLTGDRYLQEMDYEQAIAVYKSVIEIDPRNVEAYLGLADAYIGLERYSEAENCLKEGFDRTNNERITAKIEDLEEIRINRDSSNMELIHADDNNPEAKDTTSQQDGEDNSEIIKLIADAGKNLDDSEFDKALEKYRKVLELDPKNADAYLGIIESYIRQGDYDKALEYAEKGFEITGDNRLKDKIDMIRNGSIEDSKGNMLKRSFYGEDGNLIYWDKYTYDSENRRASITVYDKNGNQIDYGEYEYNEEGNTVIYYNNDENGELIIGKAEYDELGRVVLEVNTWKNGMKDTTEYLYENDEENYYRINYPDDGTYTLITRDDEGKITERKRYDRSGQLKSSVTFTYDGHENYIRWDSYVYNPSGEITGHTYELREYNENGELIRGKSYDENGNLESEMVYE